MIKIRSTQKLATSNIQGLCDVSREMLSYKEDLKTGTVTIVIKDQLFQEKEITPVEGDAFMERLIIEDRQPIPFYYTASEIDAFFSAYGTTISKTKSYSTQNNANKMTILIAQTIAASASGWHGMNEWTPDTEYKLVKTFSI